jgi:hypothetical protein
LGWGRRNEAHGEKMNILGRILAPFRRQTPTSPEGWLLPPAGPVWLPSAQGLALRAQTAGVDLRGTKPGIGSLPVEREEHEGVFSLPVDMRALGEARQIFAALAPSPVEGGRRAATDLSVTQEKGNPREGNPVD